MILLSAISQALDIAWKGMLAIFIGIGMIYLAIYLLSKIKDKN